MKITFTAPAAATENALVIPVFEGNVPVGAASPALAAFIAKALNGEESFKGKSGQTLVLRGADEAKKIILLGLGGKAGLDEKNIRAAAPGLSRALKAEGLQKAAVNADGLSAEMAAQLADALVYESYEFRKYKSGAASAETEIAFHAQDPAEADKAFKTLSHVTGSVFWASDLSNEPGNVLNPATYADLIKAELAPLGIKVTVLEQADMEKLGMGSALAVGKGSATPPRMVVMEYDNTNGAQKQPLALVGKGLTFDSGGLSLKSAGGMGDMTLDMAGSAAVVGAMRALALRQADAHVVAIVGLAENMPDGKSYRPGDILKSMSGKTIHVDNTDAEGRLVLCDALTYIQRTYNPHTVVDLATLTGAAVVALGKEFAAVYANDNKLWKKFNKASAAAGEKVWRMPLTETSDYANAMKATPLADLTNSGGRAGSCTAAAFLHQFIEKAADGSDKCKWAHIDMAGPGIPGTIRKGWGVQLLNQFVRDNCETGGKAKAAKPSPKP